MAMELAVAYVPLVPSMKGAQRTIAKELNSPGILGTASTAGQSMGSRMASGVGRAMKTGGKIAAVGLASVLGTAVVKGFGRLSAIENAEAKLTGLGNSGQATSEIMKNALASVKGTAFGMDEAATTAASAVAAGIKPGKELTKYLSLAGDAATIAGTDLASMGSIFNKVMTSGKIQGDVIAQLSDVGIPVVQMLGEELGVTGEEVYDMASKGKIGSDVFLAAMGDMGGAALKGGETTTGAFKNMNAALSRFGAELLSGVYPMMGPMFNKLTGWLDIATEKAGPLAEAFSHKVAGGLRTATDATVRFVTPLKDIGNLEVLTPDIVKKMGLSADSPLGKGMTELIGGIRAFGAAWAYNDGQVTSSGFPGFMERAAYGIRQTWDALQAIDFSSWDAFKTSLGTSGGQVADAFSSIGRSLNTLKPAMKEFLTSLPQIGSAVGTLAVAGIKLLATTLSFLADNVDTIIKFMPAIVAGFVAWKVASTAMAVSSTRLALAQTMMAPVLLANQILRYQNIRAENKQTLSQAANTAATGTNTVATGSNTVATGANTAATNTGLIARGRATVALVAQRVAMVATTAASKAMAAGQWLLNAALTANPIGLVVVALVGLGVAIVAAYKNIGWFRDGVDKAWNWIKSVTGSVFGWISNTAIPALRTAVGTAGAKALWLYNSAIKPAFDWSRTKVAGFLGFFVDTKNKIVGATGAVGSKFLGLYNDHVRPAMSNMQNKVTDVWSAIKTRAFDPMVKFVKETIPNAFQKSRDGVGRIWDGLKGVVKAPVKFVVEDVINKVLIGGYNKLNDFWSGADIDPISLPAGFRKGGRTGGTREDEVRGVVHGKETVLNAPVTRDLDRKHPGLIDGLLSRGAAALRPLLGHEGHAAHGEGGMAAGGRGGPGTYLWGALQNAIYSSGTAHVRGNAPGFNLRAAANAWNNMSDVKVRYGTGENQINVGGGAPAGTWGYAWSNGQIRLNPNIPGNMKTGVAAHEVGHVLGLDHAGTNSIMHPQMRGPLWPSSFDRATMRRIYGGSGEGTPPNSGGTSILGTLKDLISGPFSTILATAKDKFKGNGFMDAALGIAGKAKDGMLKWGMGKLTKLPDFINDAVDKIKGLFGAGAVGPHMVPELHDQGGTIHPGLNIIENRTRKAEQSLNPRQWDLTKQAMATLQREANDDRAAMILQVENMYGTPKEIVNEVERRQRRANASAGVRHIGKVSI